MSVLWALDLDNRDYPWRAHRIVGTAHDERGCEVRTAACGARFTATSHPRGWWRMSDGRLPLSGPDSIHCGGEASPA